MSSGNAYVVAAVPRDHQGITVCSILTCHIPRNRWKWMTYYTLPYESSLGGLGVRYMEDKTLLAGMGCMKVQKYELRARRRYGIEERWRARWAAGVLNLYVLKRLTSYMLLSATSGKTIVDRADIAATIFMGDTHNGWQAPIEMWLPQNREVIQSSIFNNISRKLTSGLNRIFKRVNQGPASPFLSQAPQDSETHHEPTKEALSHGAQGLSEDADVAIKSFKKRTAGTSVAKIRHFRNTYFQSVPVVAPVLKIPVAFKAVDPPDHGGQYSEDRELAWGWSFRALR
ncbi:hypothetical protein EDC04DRAFT_2612228 [Pisolithus marmoratus]|nr:hypothetical protein EDC04DRAFT_2612228 [Pisolithus marmoratus]